MNNYFSQDFPPNPNQDYYRQKARESLYYTPYQQNYGQQNFQQQGFPPPQYICYTVSSLDEARAARIDNPMNTYILLDSMNGKIYTKKIGDNGAAVLQSYSLDNPPTPMNSEEKIAMLEERIAELEGKKPEIKQEVQV